MPIIDLLELWSEAFEMNQEKAALYGEPHSQPNPYILHQHNNTTLDYQYLGDQTDPAGCLAELQELAQAAPTHEPPEEIESPF